MFTAHFYITDTFYSDYCVSIFTSKYHQYHRVELHDKTRIEIAIVYDSTAIKYDMFYATPLAFDTVAIQFF